MRSNQRNMIVIRVIVVASWLLGYNLATSTVTLSLLYLLPVLALFSFLLTDYFSSVVIGILSTLMVKTLYLDQMSEVTRAFLMDAIWIGAILVTIIKLQKRFDHPAITKQAVAKSSPDSSASERTLTTGRHTVELPVNYKHDLRTPISTILGFCKAILRADRDHTQPLSPLVRENMEAIYRNAQQVEKLTGDFLKQLKPVRMAHAETCDPAAMIQECAALLHDLMIEYGIKLDIRLDNPLPTLQLHRLTVRQILLNVLRTIARAHDPLEGEALLTVRANVQQSTLHIRFTASDPSIQQAVAGGAWRQNVRLLEMVGGRLWVQEAMDFPARAYRDVILALPLPANQPATRPLSADISHAAEYRSILVISEESNVSDFFKEQLGQYTVIGIKNIAALHESVANNQPAAIILTREQQSAHLQTISHLAGKHTPIILCPVATSQELLRQLNVVYLPKPVNYDALYSILTTVSPRTANVLIVDDNMDSAEMLAMMLQSMSHAFTSWKAYLAQDALALLDNQEMSAIILDVSLPDMDGITLVQQIRSRAQFASVPIVLVSAQETLEAVMPVRVSDRLSLIQPGGFEPDKLTSYLEALVTHLPQRDRLS